MCGIWGFVTTETQRGASGRLRYVQNAAIAGTVRGDDSTGAFLVPHVQSSADWCKVVGTGSDWLNSKYTNDKFTYDAMTKTRAVVGHNRSATLGKVTLDNAHPFQEGAITLVHNGTLDYMDDLKVQAHAVGSKNKPVEVDSHLICHNLAQHSIDEVIPTLHGAFALVWHDNRNDSLYMIRNTQRPLHLMHVKCENTVLFASEPEMLWWLAGRNQFSRGDVYQLDSGVLLEFKAKELKPVARRLTLGYRTKYHGGYSYYESGGGASSAAAPKSGMGGSGNSQTPAPKSAPVGGTSKRSRAALTLLGFDPKVELEFSVESVLNSRGTSAVVNGWAYFQNEAGKTEAIQAVVHGIERQFAQAKSRDDWHVRPVGVYWVGPENRSRACLICRLVRVSPAYSNDSQTRKCVGPHGKEVPVADWLIATSKGCVQCGKTLVVADAPHIVWVNNKTSPMCPECVAMWDDRADLPTAASMN